MAAAAAAPTHSRLVATSITSLVCVEMVLLWRQTAAAANAAAAVVAVRRATVQYRRSKGLSFLNSHSSRA